jgi:hypothetical protein
MAASAWSAYAQTPLIQVQRIREMPPQSSGGFARRLARDGGTLAVTSGAGFVTLFERSAGPWTRVTRVSSLDPSDVELAGGILYAGELGRTSWGEVVIRARDQGGPNAWGVVDFVSRPSPPPPGYYVQFGWQVEASGGLLFVSDPQVSTQVLPNGPGRVWQFAPDASSGSWSTLGEVEIPAGANFGRELAVDGDWMAATAGSRAWMLERSGVNWTPKVLVTESLGSLASLALDGDRLVVGKPDSQAAESCVLVFERDRGGPGAWGLAATIPSPASSVPYFGFSVALDGDRLCVGGGPPFASGATAVYTFERAGSGVWQAGPVAQPPMPGTMFGVALDLQSSSLLVGAPAEDVGGFANAGTLYVLRFAPIRPASFLGPAPR